jgi:hypothetical protein
MEYYYFSKNITNVTHFKWILGGINTERNVQRYVSVVGTKNYCGSFSSPQE